jgi:hypothetical protein
MMSELCAVFNARWHDAQMGLVVMTGCCLRDWGVGSRADEAETSLRRFCGLAAPMVVESNLKKGLK